MSLNNKVLSDSKLSNSSTGLIKELHDTLKQIDSSKYSNSSTISSMQGSYVASKDIHNVGDERVLSAIIAEQNDVVDTVNAAVPNCELYGLKIDKNNSDPSTRITYISTCDNANFTPASANGTSLNLHEWADVWFVKGNYPCLLSFDGKTETRLNPNDYTKTTSGAASNVTSTSAAGNFMAVIPLVWVKFDEDNNYEYIYISNIKYDDDFQAIAHTRSDGVIVSKIYMSMFRGYVTSNKMRSIANVIPSGDNTAQQEVTYAQANNPSGTAATTRLQSSGGTCDGWYTWTWGQYVLLTVLCLFIGKSDNSQAVFGNGVSSGSSVFMCGHNGTDTSATSTLNKGQFYGDRSGTTAHVRVFHIEDPWGNQWNRIAGLINNYGQILVKFHGPYNYDGAGYDTVYIKDQSISKYSQAWSTIGKELKYEAAFSGFIGHTYMTKWGRFPKDISGSATQFCCDGYGLILSGTDLVGNSFTKTYPICGGSGLNAMWDGGYFLVFEYPIYAGYWAYGCALSYI